MPTDPKAPEPMPEPEPDPEPEPEPKPGDLGYPASQGKPTESRGREGEPAERTDNRPGNFASEGAEGGQHGQEGGDEESEIG